VAQNAVSPWESSPARRLSFIALLCGCVCPIYAARPGPSQPLLPSWATQAKYAMPRTRLGRWAWPQFVGQSTLFSCYHKVVHVLLYAKVITVVCLYKVVTHARCFFGHSFGNNSTTTVNSDYAVCHRNVILAVVIVISPKCCKGKQMLIALWRQLLENFQISVDVELV